MKRLFVILLLLNSSVFYSQTERLSRGFEINKPELEQRTFARDSTANAIVIYEVGESHVDRETFNLKTTVQRKLKILNQNGFNYATLSIALYNNDKGKKEELKEIKATVYNLENDRVTKTQFERNKVLEEKYNDNYTLMKIAFPNVKEGSVIVYSYTVETPFFFKYHGWNFQEDIPKLYSEYNASIPANWEYNIKLVGGQKLKTNYSDLERYCLEVSGGGHSDCAVYKYVMEDIPAFVEENYMTAQRNYRSRIEYELKTVTDFYGKKDHITKTWKSTDSEIKKETDLGRQLKKTSLVKGLLSDQIQAENDDLKKAKSIFKYVQDNYAWNEKYRVFENISVKDLINDKSGNVGEINSLLYNLLVENDIDAQPMLLSTRQNGFITKLYPVLSDFNYLIVKAHIDGKTYLLDATSDYTPFGLLPFRCLNQYGRVLDFKNSSEWYDISVDDYSIKEYRCEFEIDANDSLKGTVAYNSTGYHALDDRRFYFIDAEAFDKFSNKHNAIDISDFKILTTEKTADDFSSTFNIESTPDVIGNTIYLNPFLFKYFEENPFKLQERSYPIDFGYKDSYTYRIKITVDESYHIKEIPEPVQVALPNKKGAFIMSTTQQNNVLMMYFKLTFNEPIYESNYYDSLKILMNKVVDAQMNSFIVLEKKQ